MSMFNLRAIVCAALLLLPAVALGFDPRVIRVGDKLKITFFETMDLPDVPGLGKGSADDAKMRVFYQRLDLSGDFTVDASGAVTMPILGAVDAAGRSATQLRDGVLAALEKAVGRAGNVSVAILQRQPVFVTGSVRNPGAYAYIPGMIAIQAVALAGGAKRDVDLSSVASRVDRRNQADSASDRLRKALARKAVLSAARDGAASVTAPPALVKLVGQDGADALIDSEKKAARLRVQEKQNQLEQKKGAVSAIQSEIVVIQSHIADLATEIKSKGEQLTKMEGLLANKVVVDERVGVVRRDFLDLEGRRSENNILLTQTNSRLAQAQADVKATELTQRAQAEAEITQLEDQIAEADRMVQADESILNLANEPQPGAASSLHMEIIRVENSGAQVLSAADTTELAPGDVLKLGDEPTDTGVASTPPSGKSAVSGSAPN